MDPAQQILRGRALHGAVFEAVKSYPTVEHRGRDTVLQLNLPSSPVLGREWISGAFEPLGTKTSISEIWSGESRSAAERSSVAWTARWVAKQHG